jgi:hypothetical protein
MESFYIFFFLGITFVIFAAIGKFTWVFYANIILVVFMFVFGFYFFNTLAENIHDVNQTTINSYENYFGKKIKLIPPKQIYKKVFYVVLLMGIMLSIINFFYIKDPRISLRVSVGVAWVLGFICLATFFTIASTVIYTN